MACKREMADQAVEGSVMVKAGGKRSYIMHSSITMTLKTYIHQKLILRFYIM